MLKSLWTDYRYLLDRLNPFKSQKGQDRWVIFKALPLKRKGYFLDLAAADGITHSNTYALEKLFGWSGLFIKLLIMQATEL